MNADERAAWDRARSIIVKGAFDGLHPNAHRTTTAVSWEAKELNISKECARRRKQMARAATSRA